MSVVRIAVFACVAFAAGAGQAAAHGLELPWINGGFELGDVGWTLGADASVSDSDEDGDPEAVLSGCGAGDIRLARGVSKGVVPAGTHVTLTVEQGSLTFYSFRMILLQIDDPEPYGNNLFALDPTGTLVPDWFDDQVLAWEPGGALPAALSGAVDLDPLDAIAFNVDGWSTMSREERAAELRKYTHMSLVIYGCGDSGGTTLDDFAWSVPLD